MIDSFSTGFLRTLWILRDYLHEIIVGGGWAPFLYYRYLLQNRDYEPVRTRDIDFMVKKEVPVVGNKTVDQLLIEAGFEARFKSRDTPPLIHYEGIIEDVEVEIEFLTDQVGSNSEIVLKVQKDLHAEALRFISIIVDNVIEVTVDEPSVIQDPHSLKVKVPTPAAYIFQKGLIFTRRNSAVKMAKDLYYIFDILTGCSDLKPTIMSDFKEFAKTYSPWFKTFLKNLTDFFEATDSEGVLLVSEQRLATALKDLDDDQFKQYIYGTFGEVIQELMTFKSP
jgi:predicted nucleotidyltransferase